MANDHISREAAILTAINYTGAGNGEDASQDIAGALSDIPAADVRPVSTGRWITESEQPGNPRQFGSIRATCSRCGAFALNEMVNLGSFAEKLSDYCPNCGADMREEANDGN